MIYRIKHKDPKFSGQHGPVTFSNGIGSTSSETDRDYLVKTLGCEDVTETGGPGQVKPSGVKKRCEFELGDDGTMSLRMFDGRRYVVDLNEAGVLGEAKQHSVFLTLVSAADSHVFGAMTRTGLPLMIDPQAWRKN